MNQVPSSTQQRDTYSWPEDLPREYAESVNYTRFGNSFQYPAKGISKLKTFNPIFPTFNLLSLRTLL